MKLSIQKCHAVLSLIFFISWSFECQAQEAPSDNIPPRFQYALNLLNQERCQDSWNELWSLARNKDYYALYILAGSAIAHPFKFSGASRAEIEKIYLPMMIYATLTSEPINYPFSIETIRRLIPTMIALTGDLDPAISKKVIDCFLSKESSDVCVKLAVEGRLIPEYDAYIATVSQINKTSLRVECDTSLGDRMPKPLMNSKKSE